MVYADPYKLEAHQLSLMDVVRSVNDSNLILPAGDVQIGPLEHVRVIAPREVQLARSPRPGCGRRLPGGRPQVEAGGGASGVWRSLGARHNRATALHQAIVLWIVERGRGRWRDRRRQQREGRHDAPSRENGRTVA